MARYRTGTGTAGNVGAEALSQLEAPLDGLTVRNPLAAVGGTDLEPTRLVKLYAPAGVPAPGASRDGRRLRRDGPTPP